MSDTKSLPYFNLLLRGRREGAAAAGLFSEFVHWGYWEKESDCDGSAENFRAALERLNAELLAPASLTDGQAVLDAGCGFGGTLAALGREYRGSRLAGVNIDARQLAVATERAPGAHFAAADACALPFADASFDRVLAVECIFHFPSRLRFLQESRRVLKPGGRLTLSDFVPWAAGPETAAGRWARRCVEGGYGFSSGWENGSYADMAARAGLRVVLDRDITAQTLPTYRVLLSHLGREPAAGFMLWPTRLLQWASRLRLVRYRILAFEKPAA